MEHIGKHMAEPSKHSKADKATERGELLKYFAERINPARVRDGYAAMSIPRIARLMVAIPTQDLYYLKSVCDKAPDFSKKFWWEIKPANHTPEAKAASEQRLKELNKKKNRRELD